MSSSVIYIDEELPELSIREYVLGSEENEMEDKKVGINVHSYEEIMEQLLLLLQKLKGDISIPLRRKAEGIIDIHKDVIKSKPFILSHSIVPQVTIERKNVSDTEGEFFEKYDEIRKIENYDIRKDEFHKLYFTYETTDGITEPQWKPEYESHTIELQTEDKARLLSKDNISGKVTGLKIYKGISSDASDFNYLNLSDKITTKLKSWKDIMVETDNLEEFVKNMIHQEWKDSFKWNKEITDLYESWKQFLLYGIDMKNFTVEQWTEWIEHLETLKQKDNEIFEFLKPLEYVPYHLNLQDHGGYTFYLIHKELIQKLLPVIGLLQESLLNLYRLFLESTPHVSIDTTGLPKTLYELSMSIYEQSADISQVIDLLKAALLKERLNELEKWMHTVQQWNPEKMQIKIESELKKYERTKLSIYDEKHLPLISLTAELKQIKKGSVITTDINEDEHRADEMFESIEEFIIEDDNPNEINIQVYEDALPFNIDSYDESQKELLKVTLRMIDEIQRASGLPLNIEDIHKKLPYMPRTSKLTQLQEKLPEQKEEFLKTLTRFELVDINSFIEATVEPAYYASIKQALEKVKTDFYKDIFNYISYFIATWIIDLQQSVLNHSLNFELWKGSVNCIQVWSPYGMPMEGLKMKKEGIVPYLLCILYDLTFTDGSIWNKYGLTFTKDDFTDKWFNLYENELNVSVKALQEGFKTFEKDIIHRNLLDKGEKIKFKIIETVEQRNKNRYLIDYMHFLQNLPSVLIQSSIAKKIHIGCCLQNLSEKYRSDYDWALLVKEAYRIKKLYATQRFGTDKRPTLTKVLRDLEPLEKTLFELPYEYISYKIASFQKINEWFEFVQPYTPINDYAAMVSGIRNLTPIIQKYITVFIHTIGLNIRDFDNLLTEKLSLQDLIQLYRKILQVQYVLIQADNDNKEYLNNEWIQLNGLREYILSLDGYFNEIQEQNAKRFIEYFIARQLCFPSKPEYAINDTLILIDINVAADLTKNFITKVYKEIDVWIQIKLYQRRADFAEYIAKQREQENLQKLQLIDMMNPEERKLYVDAKKLGLEELKEYLEKFKEREYEENQYEEIDDIYERSGEEEFYAKRGENDDEDNPDNIYDDEY